MNFKAIICSLSDHKNSLIPDKDIPELHYEGCMRCGMIYTKDRMWWLKSKGTYVRAIYCKCNKGGFQGWCQCSNLVEMGEGNEICSKCEYGTHMLLRSSVITGKGNANR